MFFDFLKKKEKYFYLYTVEDKKMQIGYGKIRLNKLEYNNSENKLEEYELEPTLLKIYFN